MSLISGVLAKHTRGYGVFSDLFADPVNTDRVNSSPATRSNP